MNVETILTDVLRREGSLFVNHPNDRGGPTRYGITRATLERWRGHPVCEDEVRALGPTEAKSIYRARYVEAPGFLRVTSDQDVLAALVDFAVHSGPRSAITSLQRVLGVTPDGVIGPQTLAAMRAADHDDVLWRLLILRAECLCRLAWRDPRQRVFLRGWLTRVIEQMPRHETPR
jgi:lysozyme family protein